MVQKNCAKILPGPFAFVRGRMFRSTAFLQQGLSSRQARPLITAPKQKSFAAPRMF